MDQLQDDSGSDSDSVSLEVQGNGVIVYDCNTKQVNPAKNNVTTVYIGPNSLCPSVAEVTVVANDTVVETVDLDGSDHELVTTFGPPVRQDVPCKTRGKQYDNLAEALHCVTGDGKRMMELCNNLERCPPDSPALSRKFDNSGRKEVTSTNPFLSTSDGSAEPVLSSNMVPTTADSSSVSAITTTRSSSNLTPGLAGTAILPGSVSQSSCSSTVKNISSDSKELPVDLVPATANPPSNVFTPVATSSPSSPEVVQDSVSLALNPNGSSCQNTLNLTQEPPDEIGQFQQSTHHDCDSSEPVTPSNQSIQLASKPENPDRPKEFTVKSATTHDLSPIEESVSEADQSAVSSFHFPDPPLPAPLICVPVKEVKFEEPPKLQDLSPMENVAERLGEIVPITVQHSHAVSSSQSQGSEDPNFMARPTYSGSQVIPKPKDDPAASAQACSGGTDRTMSDDEMHREAGLLPDQTEQEELEHKSYGIIGNEDNLSEITLPPVADASATNRGQDGGMANNGLPHHRIRISIDQRSENHPKRSIMISVGMLVLLVVITICLFGVYKFVRKSPPD